MNSGKPLAPVCASPTGRAVIRLPGGRASINRPANKGQKAVSQALKRFTTVNERLPSPHGCDTKAVHPRAKDSGTWKRNLSLREQPRKHINRPSHKSSRMFKMSSSPISMRTAKCSTHPKPFPSTPRGFLEPCPAPPGSKQRGRSSAGSSPSDVHQALQTFVCWQLLSQAETVSPKARGE